MRNRGCLGANHRDELALEIHPRVAAQDLADVGGSHVPDAQHPVIATGDWRDRLIKVLWSYIQILFDQPGLAQSALVTRPSGPAYLRLVDGILALLDAGGVAPDRASWAVDLLLHFATSTATEQGTRARAIDADEEVDTLTTVLREVSADSYPHIAALGAAELLSGGPDRVTWGFGVLISGILQTPRPDSEARPDR